MSSCDAKPCYTYIQSIVVALTKYSCRRCREAILLKRGHFKQNNRSTIYCGGGHNFDRKRFIRTHIYVSTELLLMCAYFILEGLSMYTKYDFVFPKYTYTMAVKSVCIPIFK